MGSCGRIVAVNNVELQAAPGRETALRWFYGELIRLEPVPDDENPEGLGLIGFKSEGLELRISIVNSPIIDSVDCRARFQVPCLHDAAETLKERKYPFQWVRGLSFSDRALDLLDPAGNRVEVRRDWLDFPLGAPRSAL